MTAARAKRGGPGARRARLVLLAVAAVALLYVPLARLTAGHRAEDPDRYFHLALAREEAQSGLVKVIPQAQDIGWDESYPEKELLFHLITAGAWRLGGRQAVELVPHAFAALTMFLVYLCARCAVAELSALVLAATWVLLSLFFFDRLLFLRAYALAIPMFLLAMLGLLRRSRKLLFAGAALMAAAYHAFYVVAAPLCLGLALGLALRRTFDRFYLWGFAGLACGIVATPYFPLNVLMMWQNVLVGLAASAGGLAQYSLGAEIFPLPLGMFLRAHWPHLALVAFAAFTLARGWPKGRARASAADEKAALALGTCLLFWLLALLQPRALEYAVPMTAVAAAFTTSRLGRREGRILAAASTLALALAAAVSYTPGPAPHAVREPALAAIGSLPRGGGRKVFNCGPDVASYLFFERPDLRFVDILDGMLLFRQRNDLAVLREYFRNGDITDPWGLLREAFQADYVLCSDPPAVAQLDADPRFRRLFPRPFTPGESADPERVYAYELARAPSARFAASYEAGPLFGKPSASEGANLIPREPRAWSRLSESSTGAFVSLGDAPSEGGCRAVRVSAGERARLAGATLVGLGLGPDVALWLNGRALASRRAPAGPARLLDRLVPLPAPLASSDRLVAVVCADAGSSYFGAALSFWTAAQLTETCAWKNAVGRDCLAPVGVAGSGSGRR